MPGTGPGAPGPPTTGFVRARAGWLLDDAVRSERAEWDEDEDGEDLGGRAVRRLAERGIGTHGAWRAWLSDSG